MTKKVEKIVLRGRRIVGGKAEGEALVTKERVSCWGALDPETGTVIERRHDLRGKSIKGKIFIFPSGKGSSGWGAIFYDNYAKGNGPLAIINQRLDTVVANGVIATNVPTIVELDKDPTQIAETGDLVKVDADQGIIEVYKKKE